MRRRCAIAWRRRRRRCATELALLDKYQAFSAELLRIALLGIAVFGVMLERFQIASLDATLRVSACVSMVLLVGSSGFALGHRYLSSDGMFHHLRLLRM